MLCIKVITLSIILVFSIVVFSAAYFGHWSLFHPSKKVFYEPNQSHRKIKIGGISGMYFNDFQGKTVLYCHGNNANITSRKYIIDLCYKYEMNLLLFDYQGFGDSDGTPYQYCLYPDTLQMYNFLTAAGVRGEDIVVWGESLGGHPATILASKFPVSHLVLLSTFSSVPATLSDRGFYFTSILKNIFDPCDTLNFLEKVKSPVMIIHSKNDDLIPFSGAERLLEGISHEKKSLISISGPHGNPSIDPEALHQIMVKLKI